MMNLGVLLAAALAAAPARATPPTTQTLEALRGGAVADPEHFFDGGSGLQVEALTPVAYAPLPALPPPVAGPDVKFREKRLAPGVRVYAPRAPGRDDPRERLAGGACALVGAGLIAAGLAVGGGLLLPLGGVGALLLVVGLVLAFRRA